MTKDQVLLQRCSHHSHCLGDPKGLGVLCQKWTKTKHIFLVIYHNSKVKKIEVIKDEGKMESLSWGRVRKRKNDAKNEVERKFQ